MGEKQNFIDKDFQNQMFMKILSEKLSQNIPLSIHHDELHCNVTNEYRKLDSLICHIQCRANVSLTVN